VKILVASIATAVALTLLTPGAARADVTHVTLGGVRVTLHADTREVVTVNHTHGYHARVGLWLLRQGTWRHVYDERDGRIGYGGLARPLHRVQGSGTTPLGTVKLISAFGDYWVEDNGSRFYNRYRNRAQGGFRWWLPSSAENSSERLRDFPVQYEYSVVTSYNHEQVRHRGAGIFLHVNGSGATAGCVSAPRPFLRQLMWRLDPAQGPVMAVGR
jgi:L,D-peptidoglycan transpeptidase YkuD (ErfK/YbiS/YcfS/YnhG family)